MNFLAARDAFRDAHLTNASHAGLLWSRGLSKLRDRGSKDAKAKEVANKAKTALLAHIKAAVPRSKPAYKPAFERYQATLKALPHCQTFEATVAPNQRLLVGMGTATPLEVGLTLHHTYGVPYIPGSALKGLAAHYASEVWGKMAKSPEEQEAWQVGGANHRFVFGTQKEAGAFAFMDAWIDPSHLGDKDKPEKTSPLVDDVVTPHHRDYYGADPNADNIPPPADWDSPVPVAFLSVRDKINFFGGIYSTITPKSPAECNDLSQWFQVVHELLKSALSDWGIGGKTSAGYGQMNKYRSFQNV